MSPWIVRSSAALLVAGLVAGLSFGILAAQETQGPQPEPATLTIDPAGQNVNINAETSVDIDIAGVTDPDGLGSYEFTIAFNPEILEFKTFEDGPFLTSTGRDADCFETMDVNQDGEPDPGFIRVACATLALEPAGPTGGGHLATLTFTALCGGQSQIAFDLVNLSDPIADDIPSETTGGTITVQGTPCGPTPTPTATPPANGQLGDVDCDGELSAIDAAFILQLDAGIIDELPCAENADLNGDGNANAIDALFILQVVAGLLQAP